MTVGEASTPAIARRLPRFLRWWLVMLLSTGRLPALLIAVGAAILMYGFLATDDYDVRDVVISGSDYTDAGEVAERADLLGGSIFRLDPAEAAERVAADPVIARVEVQLEFPARARVQITEREPVLIWRAGGQDMLVDDSGFVLGPDDGRDVPRVRVRGALAPDAGELVPSDVIEAASRIAPEVAPGTVMVTEEQMIEVVLDNERQIIFGFPERVDEKLQVLRALLPEIGVDWSELDLSRPERPAYR